MRGRSGGRCLAFIAGSGMTGVGDYFDVESRVRFDDVDGVGPCTVVGHRGEVRWCRRGEARFAVVLGRRHVYEGEPAAMLRLLDWLQRGGVGGVVVVSAAGSLDGAVAPGELVVVQDALDFQYCDPLHIAGGSARGGGAGDHGPRRPAVDPALTLALERACLSAAVRSSRGVLACFAGPAYETPAEVGFAQSTGATVVTMSAAPEIVFARVLGMPIAVLASVTNAATGIGHSVPGHGEVVEIARGVCAGLARIISQLVDKY